MADDDRLVLRRVEVTLLMEQRAAGIAYSERYKLFILLAGVLQLVEGQITNLLSAGDPATPCC